MNTHYTSLFILRPDVDSCEPFFTHTRKVSSEPIGASDASLAFVLSSRSRVTAAHAPTNICQMDFLNKPLLTGELKEVPGLGEVGINTLNRSGIFTTYQLIGKFLEVRKEGSNRA